VLNDQEVNQDNIETDDNESMLPLLSPDNQAALFWERYQYDTSTVK
jgi:hypothetical protein